MRTTDRFDVWFDTLEETDRTNVLAAMLVLKHKGPMLSRPYADTIKGSLHPNLKELRIQSRGRPLRAFFAFDQRRIAVLLCGGEKAGKSRRFYERLISIADQEFADHLAAHRGD